MQETTLGTDCPTPQWAPLRSKNNINESIKLDALSVSSLVLTATMAEMMPILQMANWGSKRWSGSFQARQHARRWWRKQALSPGHLALFHNTSSLQRSKKTSAANISRFVTSNSPGRREHYHIWGQFTSNYHAPANSCAWSLEREADCREMITLVHTIMKTHARASTFSHKYGHYDLVGIACWIPSCKLFSRCLGELTWALLIFFFL